jgi:LPS-assembly lipoprotein
MLWRDTGAFSGEVRSGSPQKTRPVQRNQMTRFARFGIACAIAAMTAGCFQPLYGNRVVGPSTVVNLADQLGAVQVEGIDVPKGSPIARVGLEVRSALIFNLTGGGPGQSATHKLKIQLSSNRQQIIVDINTARPDLESYGIDATYALVDLSTDKTVLTGRTFSRVSYDIPGQEQRFARARGLRDAENRAAKVIADQIQMRLSSFFTAGA